MGTAARVSGGILAGILSLVVIVALFLAMFFAHFWLFAYSTSRNAQIYQTSYGAQTAFIAQANNLVSEITTVKVQIADTTNTPRSEVPALQAQQAQETTQACALIAQVSSIPLPTNLAAFSATDC